MSGSKSRVGTHWRKPATHVYDYNYNLGEHYYKPQLNHMELKHHGRAGSPPKAKTFAERFAADPVHGYGPRTWRPATTLTGFSAQPRTSLTNDFSFRPGVQSGDLFSPSLDERGRPRFSLGDRLLDSVGVGRAGSPTQTNFGRGESPSRPRTNPSGNIASPAIQDDPFADPFFQRSKKFLGRNDGPRSADPDILEDPFKSRKFRRMDSSGDDLMDDLKLDSEEQISKFRSKLRAKRAQDELESAGADDYGLSESRSDRIRSRVKARLAELEDDFPSLSIKSGRGNNESSGSRFMNDMESSSGGASKSVRISKRSVRTTVEN